MTVKRTVYFNKSLDGCPVFAAVTLDAVNLDIDERGIDFYVGDAHGLDGWHDVTVFVPWSNIKNIVSTR